MQTDQASNYLETLKAIAPWVTGGLAGAILTLTAKIYSERRRRKVIEVNTNKQRFALPKIESGSNLPTEELTVSYKNQQYKNLSLYSTDIKNVGYGGVNNQKFIFTFPRNTIIVDQYFKTRPTSLSHNHEERTLDETVEQVYTFERIEQNDSITVSFLIDCEKLDEVQCLPRDVDDVKYFIGNQADQTEIDQGLYKFLIFLAAFFVVGSFPFIGGALQAGMILVASQSIIRFIRLISIKSNTPPRIEIGRIELDNTSDATLNIG